MFARVSTIQGKPASLDEGVRDYKEQMLPSAVKMNGFKDALLMVDRKSGKMVGITFWETEKDLQASASAADKLRARGAQKAAAAQPPQVEVYEVAVQRK